MAENIQLAGLVVDLLLNTASFEAGSTKAQRIAAASAKGIQEQFSRLSDVGQRLAESLAGPLGPAASGISQSIGLASKAFSSLAVAGAGASVLLRSNTAASAAAASAAQELAARMEKIAQFTGASVPILTSLSNAAGKAHISSDTLSDSLIHMERSLAAASNGSKAATAAWTSLGFTAEQISAFSKDTNKALESLAVAFASMPNGATKTTAAINILGVSGKNLLPVFNKGADVLHTFEKAESGVAKASTTMGQQLKNAFTLITSGQLGKAFNELESIAKKSLSSISAGFGEVLTLIVGPLLKASAAIAAVGAVVTGTVVAIGVHAAESAAKLEDLSHSTGLSVEMLSKLGAVGHMIAPDVGIDEIAKSIGRMNRQLLLAATASTTTITPFQRLRINIRDANGEMKSGEEVFAEIGDKFSNMQDGTIKSGLAMEIFGRSGASMIPILNEGGARLREFTDLAERLGATIDGQTAIAAHKLKEEIGALELAVTGAEYGIMRGLVPALNQIISSFTSTAERGKAWEEVGREVGKIVITLAEILYEASYAWDYWKTRGSEAFEAISKSAHAWSAAMQGDFSQFSKEGKALQADTDKMETALAGSLARLNTRLDELNTPPKKLIGPVWLGPNQGGGDQGVDLKSNQAKQAELTIISQIQKLQAQADAEGMLAQAISEVSSATIEATAHAEALKTIAEMNAVAGKYGVSVTKEQAAAIEQATLRLEAYKSALKVNKDLQDNIDKTKIAAESTKELAAAYQQGGEAIEKALEKAKLATLADAVNDLQELHDKLGQLPISGKSAELFNTLGKSLKEAQDKLNTAGVQAHTDALNQASLASAKLGENLRFETEELQKQINATLQGTDALKAFNAQKQIDVFIHEQTLEGHPLSADQITALRQQAASIGEAENELQVVQKFRSSENVKSIGDEIAELTKYHDVLVRDSTDELVYQGKMHDLVISQQKAWDELLLKTNDTRAGVRVFFDEMAVDGETAAQRIHDSLTSTFNSLEDTFARFVLGQKVSWKELESQIVSTFAKQSIDVLLRRGITAIRGGIEGKLGGEREAMNEKVPGVGPIGIGSTIASLFGIGKKTLTPDGTASNPLHVKVVSGFPAVGGSSIIGESLGLPAGKLGLNLNPFSDIAKLLAPPATPSGEESTTASSGGLFGSIFKKIFGIFGSSGASAAGTDAAGGNAFSDFFSSTLPAMFGFAGGGQVSGPGTSKSDSIPAMLSAGEYVINAKAVQRVGKNHLDAINSGQPLRHFVTGGDVTPGKAYILSQTHSGYSIPSSSRFVSPSASEDSSRGPGMTVVNHFHDIHDMNTFKASEAQIQGHMMRSAYAAHRRNG